ncbi:MAG: hypothetical protein GY850_08590 [bacterium]|nr:hypothetical protein [bacterium]
MKSTLIGITKADFIVNSNFFPASIANGNVFSAKTIKRSYAVDIGSEKNSDHLQRQATHFFSEVDRVQRGLEALQEGRLEDFGRLMAESCQSSIEQYECGSPAIHDLQQIVSSADGVIGSRFGGGGFGGCVVGLVAVDSAAAWSVWWLRAVRRAPHATSGMPI